MSEFKPINPEALQDNPFSLIGKGWMLITAGRDKCNAMTASWGGLGVMWSKNVAFVVVRPQRYTKEFLDAEPAFSLSFLGDEHRNALSYLGSVSGRNEDKMARCGLTPAREDGIPYFAEAHTALFCRKLFAQPYDPAAFLDKSIIDRQYPERDFHTLYIAEIVKALAK